MWHFGRMKGEKRKIRMMGKWNRQCGFGTLIVEAMSIFRGPRRL
jgi:hypothetical protein